MPGRRQRILISKTRIWPHSCTDKDIQYIHTRIGLCYPLCLQQGNSPCPRNCRASSRESYLHGQQHGVTALHT